MPRDSLAWAQVQRGPARGLWLHLNPRTGCTYFEGAVEPEVQNALQQCLRPGMIFYDIGANIGFFSLLAAQIVGKDGRVIAFEADPETAARLREMHSDANRRLLLEEFARFGYTCKSLDEHYVLALPQSRCSSWWLKNS